MKQLKRSECAILPLVLTYKWYDMIDRGEKKEEYRAHSKHNDSLIRNWLRRFLDGKDHLVVAFQRAYNKPSMWFECSCSSENALDYMGSPRIRHPEWGEPETLHYVIGLGERVELVDCK